MGIKKFLFGEGYKYSGPLMKNKELEFHHKQIERYIIELAILMIVLFVITWYLL